MKLRLIFLVLSLLAFLSVATGGYLYYASLKEAAFAEAERQAVNRVEIIQKNLATFLSENIRPVRLLAGMSPLARLLREETAESRHAAEALLDYFQQTLAVDVCYLMNTRGVTVASSNRHDDDSFVGQNFAFRPYFQRAVSGQPAIYLALGITSGKRGAYYSHPVCGSSGAPEGVVVIKASLRQIEKELGSSSNEIVMVTDPQGVVFIANRPEWLYHLLWQRSPAETARLAASLQFGSGPWPWIGFVFNGGKYARDSSGEQYLMHRLEIGNYPGWQVVHMRSLTEISRIVSDPLVRVTGPTVMTLCVLIGVSVFLLYHKASHEIVQRKTAEEALRQSEERYRSIYHQTPAMLHSVNSEGRLVSVSDHWLDILGYERQEVVGRPLADFLAPESRVFAYEQVIPEFFQAGFCKDVAYRFMKKNGQSMDVLLSAIGDRDQNGKITRSLAVSIDITERRRAEKALQQAKEELSRYSRDLERQVKKRTEEISGILKYTPAVIYIKDQAGRCLLVNSRYEELFGVCNEVVRGRTDDQFLPWEVAEQFQRHDRQVLETGHSKQMVERISQEDGLHTYLSVKFPIYDEQGKPSGVCGIATDITALKKAQDQLRRLSGSVMESQEKERSAIARGLHDELGQLLTALRLDAAWIEERLRFNDPQAAERALAMGSLIDRTIDEVRSIALRLRPGILDDLGLVDALEWQATDFERRTGIACAFKRAMMPSINSVLATAAYRIAQEALTNVARHAAAEEVTIELNVEHDRLLLAVIDNGCGFDPAVLSESQGLGVAGMRERASLVGGTLYLQSHPGRGTRVTFMVPMEGENYRG
ncbi:MAG: PAS domain S-box protein [Deltaproteobacteria bacterium]|nr:PAS domain S-box protein [Candidatus Anaeroferrophillus wilburensis]MBN2888439.1 PAS domain S-box protein [Deltaproteobacteria bacterium]